MHAKGILRALPFYVGLLRGAGQYFAPHAEWPAGDSRVDLFVPLDSPALHVPMARMAHRLGVRTCHFIAPQFWGWAPWRAKRYRKHIAQALTILPFEPHWYARHGIAHTHVGHPLLDELEDAPGLRTRPGKEHGADSLGKATLDAERIEWVLLPGSRRGEIHDNLLWMLEALQVLREQDPDLVITIAQNRPDHRELIEGLVAQHHAQAHPERDPANVRIAIGDLHATLRRAKAALAVSGTVLTDLLAQRIPAVVIYRDPGGWKGKLGPALLTCRWFASTNLIAGRKVLPEYVFGENAPLDEVRADLLRLASDPEFYAAQVAELDRVWQRLGGPGACRRAARVILALAAAEAQRREPPAGA